MITKFTLFENINYKSTEKFGENLSEDEFNEMYAKNCKIHMRTINKLYRGINNNLLYIYQNPAGHIRHSIEPQNIHVTLMSELESWKDYPKYNQSIIGSPSSYLKGYGTVYEIIPFDNTKIGICPSGTIWSSFGGFYDSGKIKLTNYFLADWVNYNSDNESWDSIKNKILNTNILEKIEILIDKNKTLSFKLFFNALIQYEKLGKYEKIINLDRSVDDICKDMKNKNITPSNIIEFIEYLFDPKLNKFKYFKYDYNFDKKFNKIDMEDTPQIWCDGPVLLKRI